MDNHSGAKKQKQPPSVDRHLSLVMAEKVRGMVQHYVKSLTEPADKHAIRAALWPRISAELPEYTEKQFEALTSNMVRNQQLGKIEREGNTPTYCAPEMVSKYISNRKIAAPESIQNMRIGQTVRSIRRRKDMGEEISQQEAQLLRDYDAGKVGKQAKSGVTVHKPSVPKQQALQFPDQQAGTPQFASNPNVLDVQVLTRGGSIIRVGASTTEQLDAVFGAIKKHGF